MDLHVAKWGNSLALRLPAEYVRMIGIKEGASVQASITADGGLTLRPAIWSRQAFAADLETAHEKMPMGTSVLDELRNGARY